MMTEPGPEAPAVTRAASAAYRAGLCVVPPRQDGTKAPVAAWKQYQTVRPTRQQMLAWYADGTATGVGVICGAVSGNLEMLEFEGRAVDNGTWGRFLQDAADQGVTAVDRVVLGYTELTPGGGVHLFWRCPTIEGNQKLAFDTDGQVLVETRGEGGYVIVAPSCGTVHPTGQPWELDTGGFDTITTITPEERQQILDLARTYNQRTTEPEPPPVAPAAVPRNMFDPAPHTNRGWLEETIDDYNRRTRWADVLNGRMTHHHTAQGVDYWTVHGAAGEYGATTNATGNDTLIVFSGTAAGQGWRTHEGTGPAPSYDRFTAHTFITTGRHDTDARTHTARTLNTAGYGPQHTTTGTPAPAPLHETIDTDQFWHTRPELEVIHDYALAKLASPWATLGVVLAHISAATSHTIVLPDIIGGYGSLNLFVGLVGPSGSGKGAAMATGRAAVTNNVEYPIWTVGSGHGIAHAYGTRNKQGELDRHCYAALFKAEEVDHLAGLSSQTGSTLLAELRRVWSGEDLGHLFVDTTKRINIEAHTYRAAFIVGIQPSRAGVILDDTDGGTPQRFLWFPTTHPHPDQRPPAPEPHQWTPPAISTAAVFGGLHPIPVCDTATEQIVAAAIARSRGETDAIDGHSLLCREKAAAALGILNGHYGIDDTDWELSETLMAVSDHTRNSIVHALAADAAARNTAKARAEADRAVIVAERTDQARTPRVARRVKQALEDARPGWSTRSDLRRNLASRDREILDDALDVLVAAGEIEHAETGNGQGRKYRIKEAK